MLANVKGVKQGPVTRPGTFPWGSPCFLSARKKRIQHSHLWKQIKDWQIPPHDPLKNCIRVIMPLILFLKVQHIRDYVWCLLSISVKQSNWLQFCINNWILGLVIKTLLFVFLCYLVWRVYKRRKPSSKIYLVQVWMKSGILQDLDQDGDAAKRCVIHRPAEGGGGDDSTQELLFGNWL
jgi:hypothetical protein